MTKLHKSIALLLLLTRSDKTASAIKVNVQNRIDEAFQAIMLGD